MVPWPHAKEGQRWVRVPFFSVLGGCEIKAMGQRGGRHLPMPQTFQCRGTEVKELLLGGLVTFFSLLLSILLLGSSHYLFTYSCRTGLSGWHSENREQTDMVRWRKRTPVCVWVEKRLAMNA